MGRPSILIVDDNEEILLLLSDALSQYYSVVSARDGSTVLPLLQDGHFDILLLDLGLPDLNGEEIIRLVHRLPRLRAIPIIVMSAYADVEERMRDFAVSALLAKPFSLDKLLLTLEDVFKNLPDGARGTERVYRSLERRP